MSTTITTEFRFEAAPLRVTVDGLLLRLFGRADIVIDRRTWRIDAVQVYGQREAFPPTPVVPGTEAHETLRLALGRQFGDEIDELAADVVEHRGGYMVLWGERMPSVAAYRGAPPYRPALSHVPDPARSIRL